MRQSLKSCCIINRRVNGLRFPIFNKVNCKRLPLRFSRSRPVRPLNDQSGVTMIQAAIVMPLVILFIAAVVDLGICLNQYLMLSRALHDGLLFAARDASTPSNAVAVPHAPYTCVLPPTPVPTTQTIFNRICRSVKLYSHQSLVPAFGTGLDLEAPSTNFLVEVLDPNPLDPDSVLQRSIRVSVVGTYDGFFIRGLSMRLAGTVPYLWMPSP